MNGLKRLLMIAAAWLLVLAAFGPATGLAPQLPAACGELAFSTEQSFVTHGPLPADGSPIISDGDLLGRDCIVCARNRDLVGRFAVGVDLGLDAVDVLSVDEYLIAFSTELDSPNRGQFTAGDLLATNGAVIPNVALLARFGVQDDLGLDALQFVGERGAIEDFMRAAAQMRRDDWLQDPAKLPALLEDFRIDLWFSTEGSLRTVGRPSFLDGDLLSARDGVIVAANSELLPPMVPAGIPDRGVDLGLDAVAADRDGDRRTIRFSTEILYHGGLGFSDGDVLRYQDGLTLAHKTLVHCFESPADFLGLDAISLGSAPAPPLIDLPLIYRNYRMG